jgi:hypothetical protein
MHTGWIIGVARRAGGRIDAEDYAVAIPDMTLALNAVRRLVGRTPDIHVWVKEPFLAEASEIEAGNVRRGDMPRAGAGRVRSAV